MQRILLHLKPFDFAEDDDFTNPEMAKTARKQSSLEPDAKQLFDTIR